MLDISPRLLEKVLSLCKLYRYRSRSDPAGKKQLLTEKEYREMRERYGDEFEASDGC